MRDESEVAAGCHAGAAPVRVDSSQSERSLEKFIGESRWATSRQVCRAKGFRRSAFPRVRAANGAALMYIGMPLLCPAIPDIFPHPGEEEKRKKKKQTKKKLLHILPAGSLSDYLTAPGLAWQPAEGGEETKEGGEERN